MNTFNDWLKNLAAQVEQGAVAPEPAKPETPPAPQPLYVYLLYMDPVNFLYVVSPMDFDSYIAHVRLGGGSYSPDGWVNLQHIHYIKNCGTYKPLEQPPLPDNVIRFGGPK